MTGVAVPDPEWRDAADAEVRGPAEELAERLVYADGSEDLFEAVVEVGRGENLELQDVHSSLEQFNRQHRVLLHLDVGFPCVDVPGGVPLPVALSLEAPDEDAETARVRLTGESEQLRLGDGEVHPHHPDEARGFLRRRLAPFLASRIATGRDAALAPPNNGFPFRVETPGRTGLRVHYSPAYFFDPTNVFGSVLSTPVDGLLLPGRYVFGTMAPPASPTWDLAATYRVPGRPDVAQVY
jgi:hypothetical protein